MNTDAQALENSLAMNKVQMGSELTRGLGKSPLTLSPIEQPNLCFLASMMSSGRNRLRSYYIWQYLVEQCLGSRSLLTSNPKGITSNSS